MSNIKKNVPELRFPGFEGEWELNNLGTILDFKNGINADKDAYGKGVKFINVLDILNNNYIKYDNIVGLVDVSEEIRSKYDVSFGDLLFQRSSESREEVGTANVYLDKEKSCTFGGFVIRGKKIGEYNPFFMKCLLSTPIVRKEITSWSGGSTRYNVGQEILSKVKYISPKEDEQNKIASFLSSIDSKVELLTKKKELIKQYKKGIMQKIFSQELRFKDDNGDDYPHWERYQKTIKIVSGNNYSRSTYSSNGYLLIQGLNISTGKIIVDNPIYIDTILTESDVLITKGDILLALNRPITNNKLKVCLSSISEAILYQRAGILKFNKNDLHNVFLYQYITSNVFLKKLSLELVGSDQPYIKSNLFDVTINTFPSFPEQKKIATFLSSIDDKISVVDKELSSFKEFKKGLLQKMFV